MTTPTYPTPSPEGTMEQITVIDTEDRGTIDIMSVERESKRTAASLVFGTDPVVTEGWVARYTTTRYGQTTERIASKIDGADAWRIDAEWWNRSACPVFMHGTFSVMSPAAPTAEQDALNMVVAS